MKKVDTKFFGQIEVEEDSIFTFQNGIPGFPDLHKYIVINEENSLFVYLQSIDNQNICFIIMHPQYIVDKYDIDISDSTVEKLDIKKPEDVIIYTILTISDDAKKITANLKAPIVVNVVTKKGAQEVIDDEQFSTRHVLFEGEGA